MSIPLQQNQPTWYKKKNYLHFDLALTPEQAQNYVTNPKNILEHRFSPLIHYKKLSRKVKRNKEAESKYKKSGKRADKPELLKKVKRRNIFYSSHIDGYIYSYYTCLLEERYNLFLSSSKLHENVIAYRAIEKNGVKFSNINFAAEAFEFIRSKSSAIVLCFDVSKFFDNMSPIVLKEHWSALLGDKLLPPDHYKVFRSLTNFSFVEEGNLIQHFKDRFAISPRKHGFGSKTKGSFKHRICDYPELRELHTHKSKNLIRHQSDLNIGGIAQGTAISGILSNIFMIGFDLAAKEEVEKLGGCYRRYSDDIFICIENAKMEDLIKLVERLIEEKCAGSIKLNQDKTEIRFFTRSGGKGVIQDEKGNKSKVQYLGFHFDGEKVHIRTSSMSKDRGKIIQTIRKYKDKESGINTRLVYKKRSPRKVSIFDNERKKGFSYYAARSRKIHKSTSIEQQIKGKSDRFIAASIKKERLTDAKKIDAINLQKEFKRKEDLAKRAKNKARKKRSDSI